MNKKEHKSSGFGGWLIVAFIATMGYLALFILSKTGVTIHNGSNEANTEFSSLAQIESAFGHKICIPDSLELTSDAKYILVENRVAEIYTSKFVYKQCEMLDKNLDILGLYAESTEDKLYNVEDSSIQILRYRYGYTDYPNCTIINWCNDSSNFGLMIEEHLSIDDVVNMLGLSDKKIYEGEKTVSYENIDYTEYNVDSFSIMFPTVESVLSVENFDGYSAIYLNGTNVINFLYNEDSFNTNVPVNYKRITVNDNLKIDYMNNNPFDTETQAYIDYNIIINTIDYSIKTIKYN